MSRSTKIWITIAIVALLLGGGSVASYLLRAGVPKTDTLHTTDITGTLTTDNLSPGQHVLEFRARASDGTFISTQTTLNIQALPSPTSSIGPTPTSSVPTNRPSPTPTATALPTELPPTTTPNTIPGSTPTATSTETTNS